MYACESRSELVLLLMGRESAASLFKPIAERSGKKPKQMRIAFDTQLKLLNKMAFLAIVRTFYIAMFVVSL